MDKESLIPLEEVLEDMQYGSGVESAARAYYYQHYCTPEERAQLEKEDRIENIVLGAIVVLIIVLAIIL